MSGTTPIGLWSRNDLRARWRSLLLLGVLAGLTAGIAIAAFDGARRTDTALHRLEERNRASDAVVFASQVLNTELPVWDQLAERPEVAQIARWRLIFGLIDGEFEVLFGPSDDVWLQQVDRPIVVEGRMFDPTNPHEVVVSAEQTGAPRRYAVGDVVHMDAFGPVDPVTQQFGMEGPSFDLHVVGLVQTSLTYEFATSAFTTPAFFDEYGEQIVFAENAMVSLRNGAADVPALRRDASTDVVTGVPVLDLQVTARRVTATTDVEQAMLALLAAIIAVAGIVFVGQALARSAAAIGADVPTLRALGMTPRELRLAALVPHVLTTGTAAIVTVATAVIASRWFPVGLAAQVDPDRGIRVDVALIAALTAVTTLLIVSGLVVSSWTAVRPYDRGRLRRRSWLPQLGLVRPLSASVGIRMALAGGRSEGQRSTSRSALVGAVAAVAGIIAIITLNNGINDSLSNPEVAGVAWDALVVPNDFDTTAAGVPAAIVDEVVAQPGLAAIGTIGRIVTQIGDVGVPTFTMVDPDDIRHDRVELVMLSGRAPMADDEVTLGPSTASDLGVGIGDTVRLADGADARVVGFGLFPTDVHAQFDEGAQVTNTRWFGLVPNSEESVQYAIAVRYADRSDIDAQIAALGAAIGEDVDSVIPAELPDELANLHNVRRLPTVLATFLTVLGAVAVGHALFSTVRRRGKEFAVLRALGITRTGTRVILAAQGTVVALVGLVFGIPLGLVAGRAGWRAITDRVPLTFRSPVTVVAILFVVPIAIAAANALAVIPGRRAAKVEPALVLRSE